MMSKKIGFIWLIILIAVLGTGCQHAKSRSKRPAQANLPTAVQLSERSECSFLTAEEMQRTYDSALNDCSESTDTVRSGFFLGRQGGGFIKRCFDYICGIFKKDSPSVDPSDINVPRGAEDATTQSPSGTPVTPSSTPRAPASTPDVPQTQRPLRPIEEYDKRLGKKDPTDEEKELEALKPEDRVYCQVPEECDYSASIRNRCDVQIPNFECQERIAVIAGCLSQIWAAVEFKGCTFYRTGKGHTGWLTRLIVALEQDLEGCRDCIRRRGRNPRF